MTQTEIRIRRAGPADVASVTALTQAAYEKWVPVIGRKPIPMTTDYALAIAAHQVDLLYLGDSLVALVEIIPAADHLLVENLAVSPGFQGRGLGRHLMAHVEALAIAAGHDQVRLYTNKLFATNIAFYLSLGYRIDREEAYKGGVIVHLSRDLG